MIMEKDKNIKSVVKYSGYSPLVKVEDKLLGKGRLFAANAKNGYCFFQDTGKVVVRLESGKAEDVNYIIYYERMFQEIPRKYNFLEDEKYFYKNWGAPVGLKKLVGLNGEIPKEFSANSKIRVYDLGIQKLPCGIKAQRYFRSFEWNPHSDKTRMYLRDIFCGELFEYKTETPEYLAFSPDFGGVEATINDIDGGFVLEKWNLERMRLNAEEFYSKNPYFRPSEESYAELSAKLPSAFFRKIYEGDAGNLKTVEIIDEALKTFAEKLVAEGKPTTVKASKLTKELVLALNKIDGETGFIESIEREELYGYIAKLLAKLKKHDAISVIDNYREW